MTATRKEAISRPPKGEKENQDMERHRCRLLAGTCLTWLALSAGARAEWIGPKSEEHPLLRVACKATEEQGSSQPKPDCISEWTPSEVSCVPRTAFIMKHFR